MKKLLLILAFVPVLLFSQTRKQRKALEAQRKADQQVINNLKSHVQFFENTSSDRSAVVSKEGEAAEYISNQFKTIGLQPKGTNGYLQQFKIDEGKQIDPKTFLKVNGTFLAVKRDYFPLSFSALKSATGMPAMALKEKGVPWFADIKDWLEDDAKKADFDITKTVQKETQRAASKGATALFLYNTGNLIDNLRFDSKDKTPPLSIPVIYITSLGYNKYFSDPSQVLDIELNVAFKENIRNAANIVGYIDNGAPSNIVIATPYELYHEENENLSDKQNQTMKGDIINGTSVLIELARMLFTSKAKNNNYTFIAYTAEDSLTPDSKWLNNSAITSLSNYIILLDKVGRYDEDKKLLIENYRTSPEWIETIKPLADKNLEVNFDSSSLQGKQSSVYQVKVPVLNFFAGSHSDSNITPADNSKINYEGEVHIARFIYRLIEATNGKGKMTFADSNQKSSTRLKN